MQNISAVLYQSRQNSLLLGIMVYESTVNHIPKSSGIMIVEVDRCDFDIKKVTEEVEVIYYQLNEENCFDHIVGTLHNTKKYLTHHCSHYGTTEYKTIQIDPLNQSHVNQIEKVEMEHRVYHN